MKNFIIKIKKYLKEFFGSRAIVQKQENELKAMRRERDIMRDEINHLLGLLTDRTEIINNMSNMIEQKNGLIRSLRQRERDLLDVIHEGQVNELKKMETTDRCGAKMDNYEEETDD
mgnify:CR=1 FL=1